MITVGKLKEFIKDLPDDTLILQDDPFSEFSFEIKEIEKCYTKINHTTNDGENFYDSWIEDDFENLLEDNPEDIDEIKKEYKLALLLYLDIES